MAYLINIFSTAAASTLLIVVLGFLLRSVITERLKNAVKHEYEREIEAYRTVLALVQSATSEGQKAAIEARLNSFDRIWKAVLAIRHSTGAISTYIDIRTVDEYKTLNSSKHFRPLIDQLSDSAIEKMVTDSSIEEARPYIGEIVWSLFFAYQAVNIRILLLAKEAMQDDETLNWYADRAIEAILKSVLTLPEFDEFSRTNIGKISYFRRVVESKILIEWQKLISGTQYGDEAIRHIQAILSAGALVKSRGLPTD